MKKHARELVDLTRREGAVVEGFEITGGDHFRLRLRSPGGRCFTMICSQTPSDGQRVLVKHRAMLRRLIREYDANPS